MDLVVGHTFEHGPGLHYHASRAGHTVSTRLAQSVPSNSASFSATPCCRSVSKFADSPHSASQTLAIVSGCDNRSPHPVHRTGLVRVGFEPVHSVRAVQAASSAPVSPLSPLAPL